MTFEPVSTFKRQALKIKKQSEMDAHLFLKNEA